MLDSEAFAMRLGTIHARQALRAYAYSLAGEDAATARAILEFVGREG